MAAVIPLCSARLRGYAVGRAQQAVASWEVRRGSDTDRAWRCAPRLQSAVLPPTGVPPAVHPHRPCCVHTHPDTCPRKVPVTSSCQVASEMPRRSEHGDQRLLRPSLARHPDGPVRPQCHRESPATPGSSHQSADPCPATLPFPRQSRGIPERSCQTHFCPRGALQPHLDTGLCSTAPPSAQPGTSARGCNTEAAATEGHFIWVSQPTVAAGQMFRKASLVSWGPGPLKDQQPGPWAP